MLRHPNEASGRRKVQWLVDQMYASQTKILEGGTKDEIRIFEPLFKGASTRFGRRNFEKYIENYGLQTKILEG